MGLNPYSKQPGIQGTNQAGFNALPTGSFDKSSNYGFEGIHAKFWTSTHNQAWQSLATHRSLTTYSHHPERSYKMIRVISFL